MADKINVIKGNKIEHKKAFDFRTYKPDGAIASSMGVGGPDVRVCLNFFNEVVSVESESMTPIEGSSPQVNLHISEDDTMFLREDSVRLILSPKVATSLRDSLNNHLARLAGDE